MPSEMQKQILNAVYLFMKPVVRFLLRSGIGFKEFANVRKIAFVETALSTNSIPFASPGPVHLVNRALNSNGYVILFSREFFHMGLQNKDLLYELPFFNNNSEKP